jgi:hypothetical protein
MGWRDEENGRVLTENGTRWGRKGKLKEGIKNFEED